MPCKYSWMKIRCLLGETSSVFLQAMDGKQSKKGNDVSVNALQSTLEYRIEQLIVSALKKYADKLQVSP